MIDAARRAVDSARRLFKLGGALPIISAMRVPSLAPFVAIALAAGAGGYAMALSRADQWQDPVVLALLLAFALVADRFEIRLRGGAGLVSSMPVYVLAAVLWGPAPAVAIALTSTLTQPRKAWQLVAGDLVVFSTFPLLTALAARVAAQYVPSETSLWFPLLVAAAFMLAWALNFALVVSYLRALRGPELRLELSGTWRPLLSTQLALALATALLAYAYVRVGAAAIVFAGALILTYSRLQRDLMEAERVRDEAEERNAELAAANERLRRSHLGAMRSLVRSIHLHDQMTARHSAAVARYARAIAREAGCSDRDQQLVHTAGLLHDVGKHILDDAILKGDTKLNDEQWELVKRHPEEGARVVRMLEGYEEIADIILAHHERIDGRGYPRGLEGEEIPFLARMISIADTYDVMTARDSYRDPVSSADAIAELRRVAGAQLDADLVDVFVERVLADEKPAFGHGDDADFEAELAFERRVQGDGPLAAGDPYAERAAARPLAELVPA